ncbi:WD40-repeat-containing domain protein [Chlamydoabsidia padenii]|nr:WD40-repeat-containing domain protein [Chlamydoabsidia padenii]
MAKISTEFISIGCNRTTHAAAWAPNGLVAFGADKFVALYDPLDKYSQGIKETLPGHKDRVTCVNFIERGYQVDQNDLVIISGSADRTAKIWKQNEQQQWINSATLEGFTGAVEAIATLHAEKVADGTKDLIVIGSADGKLRIWERSVKDQHTDQVDCIQEINCGNKYPMSLALSYLPGTTTPIIASGHTDKVINIYVYQQGSNSFEKVYTLQGHDNWVRSLAFATYTGAPAEKSDTNASKTHTLQTGDLILASGSQDRYIRIWKISPYLAEPEEQPEQQQPSNDDVNDLTNDLLEALKESALAGEDAQLSTKAHLIQVDTTNDKQQQFTIMFEALLMGHDDWVFSVSWERPKKVTMENGDIKYDQPMRLISASSDKSMMIWSPDALSGVWVNEVRMGDIGGNAALGFCGALFGPDGKQVISYGANGSFHLWKEQEHNLWSPQVTISGHFKQIEQVTWDPQSRYLVTASLDQTTRLYAPWKRQVGDTRVETWHEMGRPQVHGYDLKCVAFTHNWQFVSGADEKVLRVFDSPRSCVESLAELTGQLDMKQEASSRPLGANLPALGLSNKAVFEDEIEAMATTDENHATLQSYSHSSATPTSLVETMVQPPYEEHLIQHTLWPEMEKLYGHLYEVMCVDATTDGKTIATACKASTSEHAVIRLFDTTQWKELTTRIAAHSLTVTRVRFSHNDRWLLTVSRDRFWSLSERNADGGYELKTKNKAHARIIWDCTWAHDDTMFVTGSRDKTFKVWRQQQDNEWTCTSTIKCPEAVTALDLAPDFNKDGCYLLAVGLENGQIQLWTTSKESPNDWTLWSQVDQRMCHVGVVRSLSWRSTNNGRFQLASGGEDHSVRILNVE